MPKFSFKVSTSTTYKNPNAAPPPRRPVHEVLKFANPGASARGSTYFKRMMQCPREHFFANVMHLRPERESEPLTVGLLYHYAHETYYGEIQKHQEALPRPKSRVAWEHFFWGNAASAQTKAWRLIEPLATEPGYETTWATLQRTLEAYWDTYWKVDEWEILAIEEELFDQQFEYSARLDLVVLDHRRKGVWIVEKKTARSITEDLVDNYQMDSQILGQMHLFEACVDASQYPPLLGVQVEITSKATNPTCVRVDVNASRHHVNEFRKMHESRKRLLPIYEEMGWPKWIGHCAGSSRGYTRCAYYALCHDFPQMTAEQWANSEPPMGYAFANDVTQEAP